MLYAVLGIGFMYVSAIGIGASQKDVKNTLRILTLALRLSLLDFPQDE